MLTVLTLQSIVEHLFHWYMYILSMKTWITVVNHMLIICGVVAVCISKVV